MKGISDLIAFFIILIMVIVILLPLLFTVMVNYSQSLSQTQNVNPSVSEEVELNYTKTGYVNVIYPIGFQQPQILYVYNYTKGVWIPINYTIVGQKTTQTSNVLTIEINGYAPQIVVEIYINQTYYVYLSYGSQGVII